MVIEKTVRERQMLKEIRDLRREVNQKYAFGNIIGKNHKMQAIYELIKKVSNTDARVFITGETGVGKELVAKAIHFNSPRKNRPFVSINCGALAETLLETELLAMKGGHLPEPFVAKKVNLNMHAEGQFFWTKSAIYPPECR